MTETEAATLLLGREFGYLWDQRLLPRSCGAAMRDQAMQQPFFSDAELYNIAKDEDESDLTRALAAKLYAAEKRLSVAMWQLSESGA